MPSATPAPPPATATPIPLTAIATPAPPTVTATATPAGEQTDDDDADEPYPPVPLPGSNPGAGTISTGGPGGGGRQTTSDGAGTQSTSSGNPWWSFLTGLFILPVVARRRRPAAPVAPAVGTSVSVPKTALDVSWQAAADTGSVRTSYAVQYRPQGAWLWATHHCDDSSTQTTLRDLRPGTRYEVRVRAIAAREPSRWALAGAYSTRAAARPITVTPPPVTIGWEAAAQQQPVPITVIPAPVVVGWTAAA